jgi:hypothetical protein
MPIIGKSALTAQGLQKYCISLGYRNGIVQGYLCRMNRFENFNSSVALLLVTLCSLAFHLEGCKEGGKSNEDSNSTESKLPSEECLMFHATAYKDSLRLKEKVERIINDSVQSHKYQLLHENKDRSFFSQMTNGQFYGLTNGYIHLVNENGDTALHELRSSTTSLIIDSDTSEVYDKSTKKYALMVGEMNISYNYYSLSSKIEIEKQGNLYSVSTMDGCACEPIRGLEFSFVNQGGIEHLTLFVINDIELSTA